MPFETPREFELPCPKCAGISQTNQNSLTDWTGSFLHGSFGSEAEQGFTPIE